MKTHNEIMITFRATRALRDALEIIAKTNKFSRSSLIRILLVAAMKNYIKVTPKNNPKKPVDTKRSA